MSIIDDYLAGFIEAEDDRMGKNIKYLRNRKRLSQVNFCRKIGMSGNFLVCIELDLMRAIPKENMQAICDLYGVTVEEILTEDLEAKMKRKRKKPAP